MRCEEFRHEIPFLASGEVDGPGFREHLTGCPSCRKELEGARRLDGLLRETFERLEPGEGFEERIHVGDVPPPASPARSRPWLPWLAAAAALVVASAAVAGALVHTRGAIERLEERVTALQQALEAERRLVADLGASLQAGREAAGEQDRLIRALLARADRQEAEAATMDERVIGPAEDTEKALEGPAARMMPAAQAAEASPAAK